MKDYIILISLMGFYMVTLAIFLIKIRKERKLMQEASNAVTTGLQLMEKQLEKEIIKMDEENSTINELMLKINRIVPNRPDVPVSNPQSTTGKHTEL